MITQTVTFIDRKPDTRILYMGNEDEHQCEAIRFRLPAWLEGAGVSLLLSIGNYSDIVGLGTDRVYRPTRTHMSRPGMWTGYITATMGEDLVWNSDTFQINIQDLPEFAKKIEQENPTILEDAIRLLNTFTGVNASVKTLPSGSEATVEVSEDEDHNRTIIFGIPEGREGPKGETPYISVKSVSGGVELSVSKPNGSLEKAIIYNGSAPSVRVEEVDNGTMVTITGANGPRSFVVENGHAPVRGVDYWTDDDISAIRDYVNGAILGGEW